MLVVSFKLNAHFNCCSRISYYIIATVCHFIVFNADVRVVLREIHFLNMNCLLSVILQCHSLSHQYNCTIILSVRNGYLPAYNIPLSTHIYEHLLFNVIYSSLVSPLSWSGSWWHQSHSRKHWVCGRNTHTEWDAEHYAAHISHLLIKDSIIIHKHVFKRREETRDRRGNTYGRRG